MRISIGCLGDTTLPSCAESRSGKFGFDESDVIIGGALDYLEIARCGNSNAALRRETSLLLCKDAKGLPPRSTGHDYLELWN
jgi:hypothetical protein